MVCTVFSMVCATGLPQVLVRIRSENSPVIPLQCQKQLSSRQGRAAEVCQQWQRGGARPSLWQSRSDKHFNVCQSDDEKWVCCCVDSDLIFTEPLNCAWRMWDNLMLSVISFRLLSQIIVKWDARELMITLSRESFLTLRPKYFSPNDRPISLKAACCAFTKRSFQKQFNLSTIWTGCICLCKEENTSNWIILGLSRARALKAL